MPVPTSLATLSQTPTSNSPAGSDAVFPQLDDYMREMFADLARLRDGANTWLTSVAGTNTITATCSSINALVAGQVFRFVASANTGAVTLNINGLGAKAVKRSGGVALVAGDMPTFAEVGYNGTDFELLNPGPSAVLWSGISGKPTTITGYGITDGVRFFASGAALPVSNIGPIWHADYSSVLTWQSGAYVPVLQQIQPISASVASNALTVTYAGGVLQFRNPSLTNGAPINCAYVPSNSITIPSGATLGTVSGVLSRLVLLEAYNGGSPVLCVSKLGGGLQLDETNLISPTTISAGSTSAGVIYSASAVSANSPYRVVGFLDITEATAGTWASAPTLVQGVGGQALAALSSLGYGQKWTDVTAGRSIGTTYFNTTGKPISVSVYFFATSTTWAATLTVGLLAVQQFQQNNAGNQYVTLTAIVQPGEGYSTSGTAATLVNWFELR